VCWALGVLAVAVALSAACAQDAEETLRKIDALAADPGASLESSKAVVQAVAGAPSAVSPGLLARVTKPDLADGERITYIWLLGLTRDPAGAEPLIALYRASRSPRVRTACLDALAGIGEPKAGPVLLEALEEAAEPAKRFGVLALLGMMQYEPALPRTEELLGQDWRTCYWWCRFVFGFWGDRAVPFLLPKLTHPDPHVRMNATFVLGGWLVAPEAVEPLERAYRTERDPRIRVAILSALEHTTSDPARLRRTFEGIVADEREPDPLKFVRETLDSFEQIRTAVAAHAHAKRVSAEEFERAWRALHRSLGREGDYELLARASGPADEPRLKALRARILRRRSDESWYDYQKVNRIIILNRQVQFLEKRPPS
jgi:HEAT repeat protein